MESVAHSEEIRKSGNRSTFRIVYSNENRDFKNYDFECLQTTAGMAMDGFHSRTRTQSNYIQRSHFYEKTVRYFSVLM